VTGFFIVGELIMTVLQPLKRWTAYSPSRKQERSIELALVAVC